MGNLTPGLAYKAGNPATPADILVGALEDDQMHRRAKAVYEFYRTGPRTQTTAPGFPPLTPNSELGTPTSPTYTDVSEADHELWHPNYLRSIKLALDRLQAAKAYGKA